MAAVVFRVAGVAADVRDLDAMTAEPRDGRDS